VAACVLAFPPHGAAQTPPPATPGAAPVYMPTSLTAEPGLPRTPDGHPDFQGVIWNANFIAYLQGAPNSDLVISEERAKAAADQMITMFLSNPALKLDPEVHDLMKHSDGFPIVRGQRRSRLLVLPANGRMPFTPEANRDIASGSLKAMVATSADNPEERMLAERCLISSGLAPMSPMGSTNPRRIIQTANHVVIHTEYGGEVRIIPFSDRHGPAGLQSMLGDSIARWDGDTLVIETTGMPTAMRIRPFPALVINPEAKVIERYTRLSKDELLYQYTIEDPKVYTAPWLAEYSLYRAPYPMFEHACHEGNYALANILSGQRVIDVRGAAAKKPE
jgi:hypothetical protein